MPASPIDTAIRHLRKTILTHDAAAMTDGQLLESFITAHDELAFAALVRRHGAMVLSVCRRVLRNSFDADDAFQATFLVLVRKARSVKPREMVGNWLHGVAYRTALKANEIATRRKVRERPIMDLPQKQTGQDDTWHDLQPILDEELNRLPENYRLPILLCDLEGKSIKEATRQLGWPQGTLAGRLFRARKLLARRLTERGVALSGGAVALALVQQAAPACVPSALATATIAAGVAMAAGKTAAGPISAGAAVLMEGVLKGMMLTKLKTLTAILLVLGAVVFGGRLGYSAVGGQAGQAPESQRQATQPIGTENPKSPELPKTQGSPKSLDETKLHGLWFGKDRDIGTIALLFGPGNAIHRSADTGHEFNGQVEGTYSVDWSKTPHHLNLKWGKGPVHQTIMELRPDGKLRIEGASADDESRPKAFSDAAMVFAKQADIVGQQAEKDLAIADFYLRTRHFGSAQFYYELTRRRYPDTDYAKKALQGLQELEKHRITLPDGSKGWETTDDEVRAKQPPAPPPVQFTPPAYAPAAPDMTVPQAEHLLEQAFGKKNGLAIKLLSPSLFVATGVLAVEKDGRVRFEPFRAILFGKDADVTVIASERAVITFDKPVSTAGDLGTRTIVAAQFSGTTEMKKVNPTVPPAKAKAGANQPDANAARIGEIIIVGNTKTEATDILKLIKLHPGEPLDYSALRSAEKSLAAFNATVQVVDSPAAFKDILIKVKE